MFRIRYERYVCECVCVSVFAVCVCVWLGVSRRARSRSSASQTLFNIRHREGLRADETERERDCLAYMVGMLMPMRTGWAAGISLCEALTRARFPRRAFQLSPINHLPN